MDIERSCEIGDIEPITVAAYIEILRRQAAPPTVKQHVAAIRMLFSWLTEKEVLAMNPARESRLREIKYLLLQSARIFPCTFHDFAPTAATPKTGEI